MKSKKNIKLEMTIFLILISSMFFVALPPDIITAVTPSEAFGTEYNDKVEEILGKKHFYDLFHPEDKEKLKQEAFQVFTRKETFYEFINRNLHKNGN